jgi:hypothetical protein
VKTRFPAQVARGQGRLLALDSSHELFFTSWFCYLVECASRFPARDSSGLRAGLRIWFGFAAQGFFRFPLSLDRDRASTSFLVAVDIIAAAIFIWC